eukprot:scaffold75545_cov31-Tisochrysis_lutea.AAC.1
MATRHRAGVGLTRACTSQRRTSNGNTVGAPSAASSSNDHCAGERQRAAARPSVWMWHAQLSNETSRSCSTNSPGVSLVASAKSNRSKCALHDAWCLRKASLTCLCISAFVSARQAASV